VDYAVAALLPVAATCALVPQDGLKHRFPMLQNENLQQGITTDFRKIASYGSKVGIPEKCPDRRIFAPSSPLLRQRRFCGRVSLEGSNRCGDRFQCVFSGLPGCGSNRKSTQTFVTHETGLPLIWAGLNFHLLTASSYCTFPVKLLALARLSIEMSLRAEFLRFDRLLMSRRHQVVQSQVLHHLPVVIPRV